MRMTMIKGIIIEFIVIASVLTLSCGNEGEKSDKTNLVKTNNKLLLVSAWKGSNGESVKSVYKDGDFLYAAAGYDGVLIFAIQNDTNLVLLTNLYSNDSILDLQIRKRGVKKFAYLLLANFKNSGGGIAVADVTLPSLPKFVHYSTDIEGFVPSSMFINDKYIYIGSENGNLEGFIHNPDASAIVKIPTFPLSTSSILNIHVLDNQALAFIAAKEQGVIMVDLFSKTVLGQLKNPLSIANSIAITNDMLLIGDKMSGIFFFDIKNVRNPTYKFTYNTIGESYDMVLDYPNLYIADGGNGVVWLNIADIESISNIGQYNTIGIAQKLFYDAENPKYLYTAYGAEGIAILQKLE